MLQNNMENKEEAVLVDSGDKDIDSGDKDKDIESAPSVSTYSDEEPISPDVVRETEEQRHNRIRWSRILRSKSAVFIFWNMGISLQFFSYPYIAAYNDYFIAFGVYSILLLFSPIAVYLADTRFGRQKTVMNSLYFIFWSVLMFAVFNCLVAIGYSPVLNDPYHELNYRNTIASVIAGVAFIPPCFLALMLILVSLIAYNANLIQLGWDQLRNLPKENATLFIHWIVWSSYVGPVIMIPLHNNQTSTKWSWSYEWLKLLMTVPVFLLVFAITLCLACCNRSKLFPGDDKITNPYTVIVSVLNFVRKSKHTSQNINEDGETPQSKFDVAKEKFGGPFQNNKVEDVKSFFAIIYILLTLGPTLAMELAANQQLTHFGHHLDPDSYSSPVLMSVLSPFVVIVFVPVYTCLLRPCIKYRTPRTLKRIGLGMILFLVSIVYCTVIDTLGHVTTRSTACFLGYDFPLPPYTYESDCHEINVTKFDDNNSTAIPQTCPISLGIPLIVLSVPYILNGLAYMIFYIGTYEFIWTQTPDGMKGIVIGVFFAIKGGFQLFALLILYAPFTAWTSQMTISFPSCGFVYWLINAIVASIGISTFMWRAKIYKHRDLDAYQQLPEVAEYTQADENPQEEQLA